MKKRTLVKGMTAVALASVIAVTFLLFGSGTSSHAAKKTSGSQVCSCRMGVPYPPKLGKP